MFRTPPWLQADWPEVSQIVDPSVAGTSPHPAAQARVTRISFACPDCGGKEQVTRESTRLMTCRFCQSVVFLPPEVWNALHPVQKRTSWWIVRGG